MKRKGIVLILTLLMCLCGIFGLTACGETAECDHSGAIITVKAVTGTCQTEGLTAGKKCAKCGEFMEGEEQVSTGLGSHVFGDTYGGDENNHWKICTVCGAEDEKFNHNATTSVCGEKSKCDVCAKEFGQVAEHEFLTSVYAFDGTNHWVQCKYCDEVSEAGKQAHTGGTATCSQKAICEVCDNAYGETTSHDFANGTLRRNTEFHWTECKNCSAIEGKEAHKGGVSDCTSDEVCSVCTLTYGLAAGHDFAGGTVVSDGSHHWKQCKNCAVEDTANKVAHSGGKATCASAPVCVDCGKTYGVALNHDFENGKIKSNATKHWKQCKNCMVEDIENALDHVGGKATCSSKKVCTECNTAYGNILSHQYGVAYESDGSYHWQKCSLCGIETEHEIHTGGVASCTTQKLCEVCEMFYGKTAQHDYAGSSIYKSNTYGHWKRCALCSAEDVDNIIEHAGGKATCIERAVCDDCDTSYGSYAQHSYNSVFDVITKAGHASSCKVEGCTAHSNPINHTPDRDEADATNDKKCQYCTYVYAYATGHSHERKETKSSNGTQHWIECICGHVFPETVANHDWDGECDEVCNTCNYERTVSHDFANGTYISTDPDWHWKRCRNCSTEDYAGRVPHAGGTASCTTQRQCVECSAKYGELASHDFLGGEYKSEEGYHWKQCKYCTAEDYNNRKPHSVGTAATCTESAICKDCTRNYGDPLGHSVSTAWSSDGSNHWKKCLNTGCTYTESTGAHEVGTAATCTDAAVCKTCAKSYGTSLGHIYGDTYVSDGTYHWKKCTRSGCTYEDIDNQEVHIGGTATCTAQKKCTACGTSYGSMAAHAYTKTNSNETQHWTTCTKCNAEQSGSRTSHTGGVATCTAKGACTVCSYEYQAASGHNLSTYASDGTQHWKKCSRTGCTYQDMSTKTNCAGGTPTTTEKPTCSTCKQSYGSMLTKHIVGSFDDQSVIYVAGGTDDDYWNWPRWLDTNTKINGPGALQVCPHPTDGSWMSVRFNRNGSYNWDLSNAYSISITTCAGWNAAKNVNFIIGNEGGADYKVTVSGDNWAWVVTTINIASAKAAGVDVSNCFVRLSTNGTVTDRQSFYVDDLCVYECVGDNSWDVIYTDAGSTYDLENSVSSLMESAGNYTVTLTGDNRLGSAGKGLYVTWNSGAWPGFYFKSGGNKTINLSNATKISVMVYQNSGSALNNMGLQVRNTANEGIAGLYTSVTIAHNKWTEFTIDIAAFREANPTVDLSSCWISFGNHGPGEGVDDAYPNRTPFVVDNFMILKQS